LMEQANRFDLIHNHFDFLPLTWSRLIKTPMITTIHGFSSHDIIPVFKKYNSHTHYVSISSSDRHPQLTYLDTVYNGIDENQFSPGKGDKGYLLYFGRIHPHKGAAEAIKIAAAAGEKLLICGLVQDEAYFETQVRPWIDGDHVIYKGNVGPAERNTIMGGARALLHPISFDEPFGLSVAEAMLCGTPVIAFERGSMKELIKDGETGFLVESIEEAVKALQRLDHISRTACRDHAMEKFSSQPMVRHYMRLYDQVLKKKPALSRL
jgi:glycosyltransferase involved in cell wall biosynthesis